ncbi:ABC-2 type transport system permease protein [Diaminobutyricimonas aerilata]|uniref:ABC-2 type transport system permease protein n=1 Tax=Diaminobutyricimonas aerilata TaxID=1162967 RepID=A0A2M9CM07_9MICO|nr:ABC transporter permease [Diaminobutyricimonas aerilata]PJJ72898.1 ABC-2 type transport system permease protein [Diaminobutyricimonas aerilata]
MTRALLRRALAVEGMKTATGAAPRGAALALVLGTLALAVGMTAAVAAGNTLVTERLGALGDLEGWSRLLAVVAQITAAASVLAFGVALAWIFGREFTEGTITGMFALPVPRSLFAVAKLVCFVVWAVVAALLLVAGTVAVGIAFGYGSPGDEWPAVGRQLAMTFLSALLVTPVAWVTTVTRSLLAGVASTIAIIVIAQVSVIAGIGGWMPFAAPALWALTPDDVTPGQLAAVLLVPLVSGVATSVAWRRLQLDR